jgi:hypothetical protein
MYKIATAQNATLLIFISIFIAVVLVLSKMFKVSMSSSCSVNFSFELVPLCSRFLKCHFNSCLPSNFRDRVGYLLELSKIEDALIEGFSK